MSYSTFDVCRKLGIKRGRLREWMLRGYVEPSVKAKGVGTKALFSSLDLDLVQCFRDLVDCGLKREAARKLIDGNTIIKIKLLADLLKDMRENYNILRGSDD
jgi:hypothetical protein